ncbi:MAG TPA: DNA translocase FtsK [Anaerolineae bacterium]|nr:DNA translocase FtsK [Anaerolineae bacterium]HOQ99919.1 DNA translocase FtsK [Anaerolineae bacterium]HPL29107.1 DNA translocase FtsK [Anaerolineae bacterium]
MRHSTLDLQADRIEAVLATHRTPARVTGGVVTPRLIRFSLAPLPGVRLRRLLGLAEEVALALDAPACRIARENGSLALELPRPDPATVGLFQLAARLARIPPCAALLGLDDGGTPLLLSLASPDVAHVLIAGATGSGKTVLARAIVASLAMYNHLGQVQFILVDPKGRGFAPFAALPHLLCPLLAEPAEITSRLRWLTEEMLRRDREGISAPHLVLAIDELAEAIAVGGSEVVEALTRLTQRGREAGIHVVAGTQKPSAGLLGPLMKANFPVRLVGSVASADDARVAAGLAGTQAERLLGRGDFILVYRGRCLRFQAAYAGADELAALAGRLRQGGRTSRRWLAPQRAPALEPHAEWRRVHS